MKWFRNFRSSRRQRANEAVLQVLGKGGIMTARQLSRETGYSVGTTLRICARLQQDRMVMKPADSVLSNSYAVRAGESFEYTLTTSGRKALRAA